MTVFFLKKDFVFPPVERCMLLAIWEGISPIDWQYYYTFQIPDSLHWSPAESSLRTKTKSALLNEATPILVLCLVCFRCSKSLNGFV